MPASWRLVLVRTYVLGVLGGAVIGEACYWIAMAVNWSDPSAGDFAISLAWTPVVAWVGGLVGVAEATVALLAVLLLGPFRRWAPLTIVAGGTAAAVGPLWLTFRDGWPREHGSPAGIALSCVACLAAALLIWPALTGRPWLPAWLGRLAAA